MDALDLLSRRRPTRAGRAEGLEQKGEPLLALGMVVPAGRMEAAERRVRDQVDAASRSLPARRPSPRLVRGDRPGGPVGAALGKRRQRRLDVEGRDPSICAQRLRLRREPTGLEQRVERSVLREKRGRGLLSDAAGARDLVGRDRLAER